MPHINMELSRDLLERMRRAALERGCTRKRFITDAIENAIVLQVYGPRIQETRKTPEPSLQADVPVPHPEPMVEPPEPTVAVEPPYHPDTRMPLSEALKALFPARLQAKIESIRNGG